MAADQAEVDNNASLAPARPEVANLVYSMNRGPINSYKCFLNASWICCFVRWSSELRSFGKAFRRLNHDQ